MRTQLTLPDSASEGIQSLAIAHDVNAQYLKEEFDQIREALGDKLGGLALDEVAKSESAVIIRDFIGHCVDVLPHPKMDSMFYADGQTEVRWLQASVILLPSGRLFGDPWRPFYVIGQASKSKTTEMLLHEIGSGPVDTSDRLVAVEMSKKDHQKARDPFINNLRGLPKPLSSDEVNRLFSRETQKFILDGKKHGNTDMLAVSVTDGRLPDRIEDFVDRKLIGRTNPKIKLKEELSSAVYSPTLSRFNVVNHLSYLALAFGRTDALSGVMKKYTPEEPSGT